MIALGFVLAVGGAAALLIGLFSDSGRFVGWHIGTHTALVIGAAAAVAIIAGVRLVRWAAVRGVKNAMAQRKSEKQAKRAQKD
ncbi:hypothetical protein Back2_19910 [Nocardioides baekrokdamisoli]|uniref:Uncharacterized protein n=1 Tax=Nocardioides baekrokdamisoli TaxID=1804624 RepID=A0A3G9J2N3_9ACTN|nr:hypothetical protein [Nocardioides baekrokdamisoli]BBH17704.1 hypothetical protein Back2_19910 [Nocardioides baekrokdamisoli]